MFIDKQAPERHSDWGAGHELEWNGATFRVLGTVARGGMAEIFLAAPRDATDGAQLCVAKRFRTGGTCASTVLELFEHEAQIALRLDHPNIATHFGLGDDAGQPFLLMEYLEGQTLASLAAATMRRGQVIPAALAAHVGLHVLSALNYAHALLDEGGFPLRIVHHDVCPRNVVVGYDGTIKLLDFGIARSRLLARRAEATGSGSGVVKGKPNYMAPEQAAGRAIDARSDLFSLGVVLWELVTGERFAGRSAPAERRLRLPYAPAPRVADVRPDIDGALASVIDRALAIEPSQRFPSARAMARALAPHAAPEAGVDLAERMHHLFADVQSETRRRIRQRLAAPLLRSGERRAVRVDAAPTTIRDLDPHGLSSDLPEVIDAGEGSA